ncbi:hypothetical protein CRE_25259 [Caenorhabditis remanei]|uniref:Uncharacterized protein n=2 Tax=Caenorhabditis remanei TaxID=31234 RepID=E3LS77_CAERE|nr:hypothetical protein CRE_25259 [Caenorhabditis remanei]
MEVNRMAWRNQMPQELRDHLVGKLIRAIFPEESDLPQDQVEQMNVIEDAKTIERELFETATDREQYYNLLAEKIYSIQRDIRQSGH